MGKTPKKLLERARWVQLDTSGSGNQAVGIFMPAPNFEDYQKLSRFNKSHNLFTAKYKGDWTCLNVLNLESLKDRTPDIKIEKLSDIALKAMWCLPNSQGNRVGFFGKEKDAVAFTEALMFMSHAFDGSIRCFEKTPNFWEAKGKHPAKAYLAGAPETELKARCPNVRWEEGGPKKYNVKALFGEAKDWAPDGLQECRKRSKKERQEHPFPFSDTDNIVVRFGKNFNIKNLLELIHFATGEMVQADENSNCITLTASNRRALSVFLPERIRMQQPTKYIQQSLF